MRGLEQAEKYGEKDSASRSGITAGWCGRRPMTPRTAIRAGAPSS
jgi:hypothetical protein